MGHPHHASARPRRSALGASGLLLVCLLLLGDFPQQATAQADPPAYTQRKYKDIRNGDSPPDAQKSGDMTKQANWASNPQASKLAGAAGSAVREALPLRRPSQRRCQLQARVRHRTSQPPALASRSHGTPIFYPRRSNTYPPLRHERSQLDHWSAWFDKKFGKFTKDPRHHEGLKGAALMTLLIVFMFLP